MSYYDRYSNYNENKMIELIDCELERYLYKFLGNKRFQKDEIKISHNIISHEPYYKQLKKNLDPELDDIQIDNSKIFNYEKEDNNTEIKKNKENGIKIEKNMEKEKKDEFRVSKKNKKVVLKHNNVLSYFDYLSLNKNNKTLVITINLFVDYDLINKLELSIEKDIEEICFIKPVNDEYDLKENIQNKVLVGQQLDKLYIIFENNNQFSFAKNKTIENEIGVYLILNKDKGDKIIYGLNYKRELTNDEKKSLMNKPISIQTIRLLNLIDELDNLNKKQDKLKLLYSEQTKRKQYENTLLKKNEEIISPELNDEILNQQNQIFDLQIKINEYENKINESQENYKSTNNTYEKIKHKIHNLKKEIKNNPCNKLKEDINKVKTYINEINDIIIEDQSITQEIIEEKEELLTTIDLDYDLENYEKIYNEKEKQKENNFTEEKNENEIIDIDYNIENEINKYKKEEEKLILVLNKILCKNCYKKPAEYLLFPCQHLIWCEECYIMKLNIAGKIANNQINDPKKSAEIKSIKRENFFTCDVCNKKIDKGIHVLTSSNIKNKK
jgi:hypothetical protein